MTPPLGTQLLETKTFFSKKTTTLVQWQISVYGKTTSFFGLYISTAARYYNIKNICAIPRGIQDWKPRSLVFTLLLYSEMQNLGRFCQVVLVEHSSKLVSFYHVLFFFLIHAIDANCTKFVPCCFKFSGMCIVKIIEESNIPHPYFKPLKQCRINLECQSFK